MYEVDDHPHWISGIYLVVHSTKYDLKKKGPTKDAIKAWQRRDCPAYVKLWSMESTMRVIHVNTISGPAYVIPDFKDEDMSQETGFVIDVCSMDEWESLIAWQDLP